MKMLTLSDIQKDDHSIFHQYKITCVLIDLLRLYNLSGKRHCEDFPFLSLIGLHRPCVDDTNRKEIASCIFNCLVYIFGRENYDSRNENKRFQSYCNLMDNFHRLSIGVKLLPYEKIEMDVLLLFTIILLEYNRDEILKSLNRETVISATSLLDSKKLRYLKKRMNKKRSGEVGWTKV